MPELRQAWRELAERSTAGLATGSRADLLVTLDDLARSLAASDPRR